MAALAAPPLPDEDWRLESDLRAVDRLIESLRAGSRIDPAASVSRPHGTPDEEPSSIRSNAPHEDVLPPKSNLFAWSLLSLGLATFVCGAVLLGWSLAAGRDDLWPIGMPLAMAGQAGLIVGLVMQLEGLWQSNRRTEKTLGQLDEELSRVRHATTLLSTSRSPSAQSFYAHMSEGASPQLLMADLKGQMDLLAQQMGSKRG